MVVPVHPEPPRDRRPSDSLLDRLRASWNSSREEEILQRAVEKGYLSAAAAEKARRTKKEALARDPSLSLKEILQAHRSLSLEQWDELSRGVQNEDLHPPQPSELPPEVAKAMKQHRQILPPYILTDLIGEGAVGKVWKAWDPRLDRFAAVKILKDDASVDARHRFLQEARIAARIRHPGIVEVHDVGTVDGRPYMVMEFVEAPPPRPSPSPPPDRPRPHRCRARHRRDPSTRHRPPGSQARQYLDRYPSSTPYRRFRPGPSRGPARTVYSESPDRGHAPIYGP